MLARYSIRAKIIAVVALLLVAMTGMGLLAVKNMRAINANTVDITTSWLPSQSIGWMVKTSRPRTRYLVGSKYSEKSG